MFVFIAIFISLRIAFFSPLKSLLFAFWYAPKRRKKGKWNIFRNSLLALISHQSTCNNKDSFHGLLRMLCCWWWCMNIKKSVFDATHSHGNGFKSKKARAAQTKRFDNIFILQFTTWLMWCFSCFLILNFSAATLGSLMSLDNQKAASGGSPPSHQEQGMIVMAGDGSTWGLFVFAHSLCNHRN